ncbi:MAG: hypothetical protein LBQ16_00285, partial [Gracilibacteraceae bacterium]|nr:hypothetical protein [Gracilibacteraceae bacterium]
MILSLNYGDLSGTVAETNHLASGLGQYCDDLSRRVQQKMYSVQDGASPRLNSADYYVNAKINQLRARENNGGGLAAKTQALLDTAKRVDEDVERTINANRESFFQRNPDLRPPWYAGISFVSEFIDFCRGVGERIKSALAAVIESIRRGWEGLCDWWEEGGWQVVLTVAVGVLIAAACIATGGLVAVAGAGLLIGLGGQIISDVIRGETSSWETYLGAGVGGAAGTVLTAIGAGPIVSGAVSGAISTGVTGVAEWMSGKSQKSVGEFFLDLAISAGTGAVMGK